MVCVFFGVFVFFGFCGGFVGFDWLEQKIYIKILVKHGNWVLKGGF